jgi:hypothetical protein
MNAAMLVQLRREANRRKWGDQAHPDGTGPTERRRLKRKAAKDDCNAACRAGTLTWDKILREEVAEAACEKDEVLLVAELTDVAAVAQDWIDAILSRNRPAASVSAKPVGCESSS